MGIYSVYAEDDGTIFSQNIDAVDQADADEKALDLIIASWESNMDREDVQGEYNIQADTRPDLDAVRELRAAAKGLLDVMEPPRSRKASDAWDTLRDALAKTVDPVTGQSD